MTRGIPDGRIGTGSVFFKVLSPGTHTITASVTDTGGKTGSRSIIVAVQAVAKRRGVLFQRVEVRPSERSHRLKIGVTLSVGGQEVGGEYETADSGQARVQGAARAAVVALDRALPSGTLELEGAMVIEAFGLEFVFAGVHMVAERGSHLFTGTCEVKRGAEEAAVLAVLDATNRWLQSQR